MDLIFAGTPEFARIALDALVQAGHRVRLVLTRADKPAGRGQRLVASPVKQRALALGLPVEQPTTLREPAVQARLAAVGADAMVVAAYGLLLPAEVLMLPRHGCLNIHASLLPRWRGAAPIQRAIAAGDRQTGITIMQMDSGLDTGPMLLARALPIGPQDTAGTLHERLARLGGEAMVEALAGLQAGTLTAVPQPADGATYARKLERADQWLDFSREAQALADLARALDPAPGALARLDGEAEPCKLWRLAQVDAPPIDGPPGTVRCDGSRLFVRCGDGTLEVLELQRPGGRRLGAAEWLRGQPLASGRRFEGA